MFPDHSVEDNLVIAAKKGPNGRTLLESAGAIYELFPLLDRCVDALAGRLSGGEQQMLAIARMLMGNPVMLLLDEPSEGLAPIVVARIGERCATICATTGATMLLAEQNMHFCLGSPTTLR